MAIDHEKQQIISFYYWFKKYANCAPVTLSLSPFLESLHSAKGQGHNTENQL